MENPTNFTIKTQRFIANFQQLYVSKPNQTKPLMLVSRKLFKKIIKQFPDFSKLFINPLNWYCFIFIDQALSIAPPKQWQKEAPDLWHPWFIVTIQSLYSSQKKQAVLLSFFCLSQNIVLLPILNDSHLKQENLLIFKRALFRMLFNCQKQLTLLRAVKEW